MKYDLYFSHQFTLILLVTMLSFTLNVSSANAIENISISTEITETEERGGDKAIDSSEWVIGTVTIEEANLYKKNYEEYLKKSEGTSKINKTSFELSDKMLRVIKRQKRDSERGQTGIRIVIGAKNPNASVENLNIIYMIYPVDKDDDIIPFSRGKKVHSLCIPQANFRVKPLCPPYCD